MLEVQVPFHDISLHIYVQLVLPNPCPGNLGKNMQYTSKTEDIRKKTEGKGQRDHAASGPMAISELTCTVLVSLEGTGFKFIHTA